jgi:hypothetical protein
VLKCRSSPAALPTDGPSRSSHLSNRVSRIAGYGEPMADEATYGAIAAGLLALVPLLLTQPRPTRPLPALSHATVTLAVVLTFGVVLVDAGFGRPSIALGSVVLIVGVGYVLLPRSLDAASVAASGAAVPAVAIVLSLAMAGLSLASFYAVAPRVLLAGSGAGLLLAFGGCVAARTRRDGLSGYLEQTFSLFAGAVLIMYFESAVLLKYIAERPLDEQVRLMVLDIALVGSAFVMLGIAVRRVRRMADIVKANHPAGLAEDAPPAGRD